MALANGTRHKEEIRSRSSVDVLKNPDNKTCSYQYEIKYLHD